MGCNNIFSPQWWKAAGVRALKTFAQTATAMISAVAMVQEINWVMILYTSFVAGVLSILTSLAGLPEVTAEDDDVAEDK